MNKNLKDFLLGIKAGIEDEIDLIGGDWNPELSLLLDQVQQQLDYLYDHQSLHIFRIATLEIPSTLLKLSEQFMKVDKKSRVR